MLEPSLADKLRYFIKKNEDGSYYSNNRQKNTFNTKALIE